jgi:hypothetical protein
VGYATSGDATVSELYRRSGAPYPRRTSGGLEWTLRLIDADGRQREIEVQRRALGLPLAATEFGPGARFFQLDGRPAMEDPLTSSRHIFQVEVQPGVVASAAGLGDDDAVLQLLTSLVDVPPTDPRLSEYAFDEVYGG